MAVLFNLSPQLTDDFGGGTWIEQSSGTHNIVDGVFKSNHAVELIQHRIAYYDSSNNFGVVIDPTIQSYSLCFWVKAVSWSGGSYAWMEIHSNDYNGIYLSAQGRDFGWRNGSTSGTSLATFEQDDATWHFVAVSVPAGQNGTIYLDGVQVATGVNPTAFNQYIRVGGASGDGGTRTVIDDWCYLDYAIGNVVPTKYLVSAECYAYLSSNSLYTGTSLTNLTNNWSGLTSTEKEALVESFSDEIPSIQDLASISPFMVLTNSASLENVKVTGQPKTQTIEPTSLINTGAVSTIQSINITNTITDATVKFAITTDLTTYKVYDATEGDWVISNNIEEDGMSIAQINALTPEILALLDISNGIAFKQCFIATSENASAELSEISAVVDIDGSWSQSIHGTDYNVAYPNKTTMSVRLLTNGDYIINYPISSNS